MSIPVQRVVHMNLNCRDQHRSATTLRALGFNPASRLCAEPQDGAAMGIEGFVQWDGFAMVAGDSWDQAMLDLLKFCLPPTIGQPYASMDHIGFHRLQLRVLDIHDAHRALIAGGQQTFVSEVEAEFDTHHDDTSRLAFSFCDTDGIWFDVAQANDNE